MALDMVSAVLGAILFLLAAIWEAHAVAFLPAWLGFLPLWPCVVIALCLESEPVRVAAALALALVWRTLAAPDSVPPLFWVWLPLLFGSFWLLRVWLSHRSIWSALVLVFLGRLVWVGIRLLDLSRFSSEIPVWQGELQAWGIAFAWDVAFILIGLPLILALNRRLSPYLPRFVRRDRL